MDDEVRENFKETHPIGTIITITHNGYTDSGKPRFARYLRKRDDVIIKEEADSVSHEKRDKVIEIFNEISEYEKANGQTFKANSYKKVITGLKKLNSDIELTEYNIRSIKGVGDSLFLKINDILTTGTCSLYEKIKGIDDPRKTFLNIHGVGPKKAKELVDAGYKTIEDLRAIENKKEVFNDVQIMGLNHGGDLLQRIPLRTTICHEKTTENLHQELQNAVLTIAGSYRNIVDESGDTMSSWADDENQHMKSSLKDLQLMVIG